MMMAMIMLVMMKMKMTVGRAGIVLPEGRHPGVQALASVSYLLSSEFPKTLFQLWPSRRVWTLF